MHPGFGSRRPFASLFWPPLLSVSLIGDLYALAYIGFHPHGAKGYLLLALFVTLQAIFFWFGARSLLMFHTEQERLPRHSLQ